MTSEELRRQAELASLQRDHVELASQFSNADSILEEMAGSITELHALLKDALKLKKPILDNDEAMSHFSPVHSNQHFYQPRALKELKQYGTVVDYQANFEDLANQIRELKDFAIIATRNGNLGTVAKPLAIYRLVMKRCKKFYMNLHLL
ncbi:hypothetical protein PIB30_089082 [Stylosanthes scabra]|uniref:Uncharacterized protein n=1 Tax=Stylosanthes scabra TaxID=79078 RepID=A0ABU6RUJ5_9FABA|nr:hypothetical protein [Stylosanthes scabra]